jgi:hypothetical protein
LSYPGHLARMPEISEMAVILDGVSSDHEHDHGGFPNPRPGHGSLLHFSFQL